MAQKLEIISVGKELLMGKIPNVNAHWLAKRATTLGLEVDRIVTVTDDTDLISSVVREAINRKPRFIITTGGLGQTSDDKTLEGIAKGTGRELELNDQALKNIVEKSDNGELSQLIVKRVMQICQNKKRPVYEDK